MAEVKTTRIILRHDITNNWSTKNPVLLKGEMGLEFLTDGSVKMKVGDGITAWSNLAYTSAESTGSTTPDTGEGGASSAEVEALKQRVTNLENSLTEQNGKFETVDALLAAHTDELAVIQDNIIKLSEQDVALSATIEEVQGDVTTLQGNVDTLQTTVNALSQEVEGLKNSGGTGEGGDGATSEEFLVLTGRVEVVEQDIASLKEVDIATATNIETINTEIESIKAQLEAGGETGGGGASSEELTALTGRVDQHDIDIAALQDSNEEVVAKVTTVEESNAASVAAVEAMQANVDEIKAANEAIVADNAELNTRVETVEGTAAGLTEKMDLTEARVDNLLDTLTGEETDSSYELRDIRVGYDGTTYTSAGGAVRQIGYDLKALHDELQDFIGANAVDGLAYENNKLWLTANGVQVGDSVEIIGGTGSGSGTGGVTYSITLLNELGSRVISVAKGDPVVLKFNYTSVDDDSYPDGPGICTVTVNNVRKTTLSIPQGSYNLDVTNYLIAGENTIRIKIENSEGSSKTLAYTVNVLVLAVTTTVPKMSIYNGSVALPYTVTGQGPKTVHFIMDNRELSTEVIETSGISRTYVIPEQVDGAHIFEIYATAYSEGTEVSSEILQIGMLYTSPTMTDTAVLMLKPDKTEISQGETLTLSYMVYNPFSENADIILTIYNEDGTIYDTPHYLNVDRAEKSWSTQNYPAGVTKFQITCGEKSESVTLNVIKSTFNKTIITDGQIFEFNATGRSNNEENPDSWHYGDIEATFDGFGWSNVDGWIDDENGQTVLRFLPGNTMTIPFYPFGGSDDIRVTGYTIEAELATHNVRDYDTVVISSVDEGRGFMIKSQQASLSSEGKSIQVQFKEDSRVRITFVVEQRTLNRFIYIYINGIMCGVAVYPEGDNFNQANPVGITIGAESCGLDLYILRIYNKGLTDQEQLNNFICDRPTLSDRINADERNDILNAQSGEVTIQDLPMTIPYIILECEELPTYKGDKKRNKSVTFVDQMHPERSFTANGVQLDVQGTSSEKYPVKNYKVSLKNGLTYTNSGETASGFPIIEGGLLGKNICLKADYASSENANNVMLVDYYEENCPYKDEPQLSDGRVRQGIRGFACVVFWNNTKTGEITFIGKYNFNDDKSNENVFGFDREKYPNCECWEFCNNTSNRVIFKESDYEKEVTVVKDGIPETHPAWYDDFEARFPDLDDPYRDYTQFKRMTDWVVSTNRDAVDTEEEKAALLQKFKDEFENYFIKDACIFYYLFTEVFLMIDNRAKNMFLTTFDGEHWFPIPYDFDSALGINNEGELKFNYDLEDTDQVNKNNVFNGQESTLWCNVRDAFGQDIKKMYENLRSSKKFSYETINQKMADHQATWPEVLWNEDAKKKWLNPYVNQGIDHLKMLQGDKKAQRDWWLFNDFKYRDSKYQCGDANTNFILLRGYTKGNITVTPYSDIWPRIQYSSNVIATRGKRNVPYELECTLDGVNDTDIYIYSADRLASVGDLSSLKVGLANFASATKLQEIILGSDEEGYDNPNLSSLSIGNNELLTLINVRNCSNDEFTDLDASGCHGLETILAKNTKLTGINLPNGGHLHTLELPETITNLTIQNQKKLTNLTLASQENIFTLRIENTPGLDIEGLILNSPKLNRVRLINVEWTATNQEVLENTITKLKACKGLDASGANIAKAIVTGRVHINNITDELLQIINDTFPELVVVVNGTAKFFIRYFNYDNTLLYRYIASEGDNVIDPINPPDKWPDAAIEQPTRENTEDTHSTWRGWSELPTNISKPYNIIARYDNVYRVRFCNSNEEDGEWKSIQWVKEGESATEPVRNNLMATPTKTSTAQYNFKWNGWDRDYTYINKPSDFLPTFESILRDYPVYFYNEGVLLYDTRVFYNEKAKYPYDVSEIKKLINGEPSDYYEFIGWSPSLDTPIVSMTQFEAQFAFNGYIEDDWATIIAACQSGNTDAYGLGGRKIIEYTLDGVTSTIEVEIAGKNHDNLATEDNSYNNGSGKAALTFIAKTLGNEGKPMNNDGKEFEGQSTLNAGGWEYSDIREWINSTMRGVLPDDLKEGLRPVIKISDYGFYANRLNDGTVDTLWIPSDAELNCEDISSVIPGQGTAYPIYNDRNSRVKTGSNGIYWTRSTGINGQHFFRYIDMRGYVGDMGAANHCGIAIGFCI